MDAAMSGERLAVFAYGSLVSAPSAAHTLGRPVDRSVRARLPGWRRRWSLCRDNLRSEKTFALAADGAVPPFFLGLNLERDETAGDSPNGALIAISDAEAERLDGREMRYDRVEVTGDVSGGGAGAFDHVFAYIAKPERHAAKPPHGAVVNAAYARAVEAAFADLGPGELDLYRDTTEPCPVEVVEAVLVRDEIPPGNPRGW
jgi:cation transport regulator ChaC